MNETALSTLSVLPSTKEQRESFVFSIVDEICSGGNVNPLDANITIKAAIDTLKEVLDNNRVKALVMSEADKWTEKSFVKGNFRITKTSKSTNDFSGCDTHLDSLYIQMEQLKAQIKAREALVKTGVDSSTGEVFKPVKTTVNEFLKIELIK